MPTVLGQCCPCWPRSSSAVVGLLCSISCNLTPTINYLAVWLASLLPIFLNQLSAAAPTDCILSLVAEAGKCTPMVQMAVLAAMVGPRVAAAAAQAALEALAADDPAAAQEGGDKDVQMSDAKPSGRAA